MKFTRIAIVALSLAVLGAAAAALAGNPDRKPSAHDAKLERGRYLSVVAGCNDCHTPGTFYGRPDFDRKLSGSEVGWVGPWGVTFPRNLTPDVETGIGAWSEQQIVTAIRTGTRPDGSVIQPPMPWPMYAQLSDADAYALAAYLKSIPPVKHRAPSRLAPGVAYDGPALRLPAPPEWDVRTAAVAAKR